MYSVHTQWILSESLHICSTIFIMYFESKHSIQTLTKFVKLTGKATVQQRTCKNLEWPVFCDICLRLIRRNFALNVFYGCGHRGTFRQYLMYW